MADQEASGYCDDCKKQVMIKRKGTSHILHLLITVVLGVITAPFFAIGAILWLGVWFLSSVKIGGWRCTQCGRKISRSMGT